MATELAKAYVQIVPSAEGMKSGIEKVMGAHAEHAGHSAGVSMGGKLVDALKGVLATAALGKALSASITEGGALEQSIGGVETLFKDSAERVQQYANEAYKTAGVSANAYMETVTGFSASLLQSLGGDTQAAAEVAHMAMVDMSDNANKMGTDMGSIQNAYQGFAKQNYTMLDNLKLGYGGTKEEMQRLLKDAQKLTGVKYKLDNLADVYEAIHVIQNELDITGTTAKEAETTLVGSAASMRAAFSNVLGGLALGQDITPALTALAQTCSTFLFGNLLPMLSNIVTALPQSIATFISAALPQVLPILTTVGGQLLDMLRNGVVSALPALITDGGTMIQSMITGIITMLPEVLSNGRQLLDTLIQGIRMTVPSLVSTAVDLIGTTALTILQNLPEIISAGSELLLSLIEGVLSLLPDLVVLAIDLGTTIWDNIQKVDWGELGSNIIEGLKNGIGTALGGLVDAAKNAALSAFNAAKRALGIHSPSRLFRDEIGKQIPAGMALGIEKDAGMVSDAVRAMSEDSLDSAQRDLALHLSAQGNADALPASGTGLHTGQGGIVVNVYATPGMNVEDLTQTVVRRLTQLMNSKEAVFA